MLIQLILAAVLIAAGILTWRRAWQRVVSIAEALGWSLIWGGALVVVLSPGIASRVAAFVGVGRGTDMVMYISVPALFWLVFRLFIQQEELKRTLTRVVREHALRSLTDTDATDSSTHV